MGLFDFLFGKKNKDKAKIQTNHVSQTQLSSNVANSFSKEQKPPFSKNEFERAIRTLAEMSYLFRDSGVLRSTGGGRNERIMGYLHSYADMLGYLYEVTYEYGKYASLVDKDMCSRYALILIAMSDKTHREKSIKELANNWSDILQSVLYLQIDGTPEGNKMKALQPEIDFVTRFMETLSGGKCRKPKNELETVMKQSVASKDKYAKMIDEAVFNPFKITTNPTLEVNPPLPVGIDSVFRKELLGTYNLSGIRQAMDDMQIFSGYVFNMVESYFNNAHYVPKKTVDAIIEQCYNALKGTPYIAPLGSIYDVKDYIYFNFTHK